MDHLTRTFAERGDLAHLALFLWASGGERAPGLGASRARRIEPAVQRLRRRDRAAEPLLQRSQLRRRNEMRAVLAMIAARRSLDHRAVFSEFVQGLARVLRRPAPRARVRAVDG
jgi:hypothetical protein